MYNLLCRKFTAVCRKIATSCLALTFWTHDAAASRYTTADTVVDSATVHRRCVVDRHLQLGADLPQSADDRNRLEAVRRLAKFGYRANSSATFTGNCDVVDNKLVAQMTGNRQHPLHPFLPPERHQQALQSSWTKPQLCQLPDRTSVIKDKTLLLYEDVVI